MGRGGGSRRGPFSFSGPTAPGALGPGVVVAA